MRSSLILTFLSLVMFSAQSFAQTEGQWSFSKLDFARGGGCTPDTVSIAVTPTAFTVIHDSFAVESGDGIKAGVDSKICYMRMRLNVAKGYQVSLATVDYRGFASLEQGSQGHLHSWYLIYGKKWAGVGSSKTTRFIGPFDDDYFRRDELRGAEKLRWSPCGGEVTVDLYAHLLAVSRRKSQALITVDAADGAAEFRYGLDVRKCK